MSLSKRMRHELIRTLVRNGAVKSQKGLSIRLKEEGIEVTQATLSRDLKAIGVIRSYDPVRGYHYTLQAGETASPRDIHHDLAEAVTGIEFSGNLVVIKTRLGYATGVAFEIDKLGIPEVIGTVGGDDTLLVILRENASREPLLRALT